MIGFFHVLFRLGKFIWWSEKPDLQYLARTPHSVRASREAGPAYLSVELDGEDVVGVTVVADLRPLLEMVDVHALRRGGAHHNYQTAGEKTLHDVNIRSFCRGQRTAGDQYLVSVPTGPLQTNDLNYYSLIINQIFLLSYAALNSSHVSFTQQEMTLKIQWQH